MAAPVGDGVGLTGKVPVSVGRSSGVISVLTAVALLLGLLRDAALVATFGVGDATDAFIVATLPPFTLASLATTASLNVIIVPVYSRLVASGRRDDADAFASNLLILVAGALTLTALAGCALARPLVSLLTPGLAASTAAEAAFLLRIAFPAIVFLGVGAFLAGILNAQGSFGLPAVARLATNGATVLGIVLLARPLGLAAVTGCALLGSAVQLAVVAAGARGRLRFSPRRPLLDREIVHSLGFLVPVLGALLLGEATQWVMRALASEHGTGGLTVLSYAQRLYVVPMTVLGAPLGQVLLPRLSALRAGRQVEAARRTILAALRMSVVLMVPVAVVTATVSTDIARVLFGHRPGVGQSVLAIGAVLSAYAPVIPLAGLSYVLLSAVYASELPRWALTSWLVYSATVLGSAFLLIGTMGLPAIALATVGATVAQVLFLLGPVSRRFGLATGSRAPLVGLAAIASLTAVSVMVGWGAGAAVGRIPGDALPAATARIALATALIGCGHLILVRRWCPVEWRRLLSAARQLARIGGRPLSRPFAGPSRGSTGARRC